MTEREYIENLRSITDDWRNNRITQREFYSRLSNAYSSDTYPWVKQQFLSTFFKLDEQEKQLTPQEEQTENLERVTSRIGAAIVAFCEKRQTQFHVDDMRRYVEATVGKVAPGSPDRILRNLRSKRKINYRVVNRRQSLYEVVR